jgi:hypothetical protein
MLHCYLKIAYYVALIIYHCVDIVSDWIEFGYEVCDQGKFAGVSTNSTTIKGILGFSCASGTVCSVAMLRLYVYYISFHCECSQISTYRLLNNVEFQRDSLLNCSDDNESKTAICNRHFVLAELVISNIELYFKDSVQSVLLIYMYSISQTDLSSIILPEWHDILFAVCSIVANLKLCICFTTKVCGSGSGEKMPDCESWKCFFCILGMIGSFISGVLSSVYLGLA